MQRRSWMYRSSVALAHFKGVCAFLEIVVQHTSRQKEEIIYYPCKVCKNYVMFKDREVIHEYLVRSGFMDNNFIWTKHGGTQLRIKSVVDEREEENMYIPNDVYSHRGDGCADDAGHGDECFDVEELMRNIVPNVLL
jgi:hypothetical protein